MSHEIVIRLKMPRLTRRARWIATFGAFVLGGGALAYAAVPNTFHPGDTLSASQMNDNFGALQDQITLPTFGSRAPSAFHATATAQASVTGAQKVVFDSVDFDLAGEYNKLTGTFVANNAGIYLVTCNLFFVAGGTPATFGLVIYKNGNNAITTVDTQAGTSTTDAGGIAPAATATVQLAAGDNVTCVGGNESGATQALDTNSAARNTFSATRIY